MSVSSQQTELLVQAALQARGRSVVPISHFAVGAALLAANGQMFVGCNIECFGQTPSICAERVALFKALSEGVAQFTALAVAGGPAGCAPDDFCPPCGVCRQVLTQFCPQAMPVLVAKSMLEVRPYTLAQLLPHAWLRKDIP